MFKTISDMYHIFDNNIAIIFICSIIIPFQINSIKTKPIEYIILIYNIKILVNNCRNKD